MDVQLTGQVAIITGASTGIGQACAVGFGKEGMKVVVNYHSGKEDAEATAKRVREVGGEAITVQADVSREEDVERLFQACLDAYGHVDVVLSNAGVQADAKFHEMTLEEWNKVISVDLTGNFLVCRAAVRQFRKQGIYPYSKAAGKIICMSSVHDEIAWAGHVNYAAAKGGVKLLMESMAQELGQYKIRVNSISPGAIKTDINQEAWGTEEAMKKLLKLVPYNRIGQGEDVANLAVFLASDVSDYITGATIYIDGGMMVYPGFQGNG